MVRGDGTGNERWRRAVEAGYDICAVQELLAHRHVSTTMIDTHVLYRVGLGVRNPTDMRDRGLVARRG